MNDQAPEPFNNKPEQPTPKLSFGAQVLVGLLVGLGFGIGSAILKYNDFTLLYAKLLLLAAVLFCLVPRTRGVGVGLLLGLGLSVLIFIGICFANFKI